MVRSLAAECLDTFGAPVAVGEMINAVLVNFVLRGEAWTSDLFAGACFFLWDCELFWS